jgi:sugar transferase (PEP-CTERM/EpsH1 system associated)
VKILWVKTDFLHPTNRGGQIRSLETLRQLHRRHEVHYLAMTDDLNGEGVRRAREYCTHVYPVLHQVRSKASAGFILELARGLYSPLPVAVERWKSASLARQLRQLLAREKFDSIVCDFLFPAPNFDQLEACTLFQHNVEAEIWRRHAEHAATPLHRAYFNLQWQRMQAYEAKVCKAVRNVIAVSEQDAERMRQDYGVENVEAVATGVDVDYFAPPSVPCTKQQDLVFVGSMDWMPNTDGVSWFASEVLPRLRKTHPQASLLVVGRQPGAAIRELAAQDERITVTGTVDDVRPWMHQSRVSIVPLRIGGGTRLKIYEAMAAGLPVVSTTVGAEGLTYENGRHLVIADEADAFAAACGRLLDEEATAREIGNQGLELVRDRFSWAAVNLRFESLLGLRADANPS